MEKTISRPASVTSGAEPPTETDAGHQAGTTSDAAGTPGASEAQEVTLGESVRFEALQNAYYHSLRAGRLDALHRAVMFINVIGGTAAAAAVLALYPGFAVGFALVPTVFACLDLVCDFSGRAAVHRSLQAKFFEVIAHLERPESSDPVAAAASDMSRIYAEEPASMRVVQALAHNMAIRTLGRDPSALFVIPGWKRMVAHFASFAEFDPETKGEMAARAGAHPQ